MIVCDLCGSRNIRQEATIMLNPNDNTITIFDNVGDDLYWNDFYLCMGCDEECQPIEDPHEKYSKEKK